MPNPAPGSPRRASASGGEPIVAALPDSTNPPADRLLEERELASLVWGRAQSFQQRLAPREAAVFHERLLNESGASLRRLATRFSISRERIRQIEKQLVNEFRSYADAA